MFMPHVNSDVLSMVFGILFFVSEGLALIPGIQSNSIFQLIFNVIKKMAGKE